MNSRAKKHGFERQMAEKPREIWSDCYMKWFKGSLWIDHCLVDLVGTPGFNVQLKALEHSPSYHSILSSMPKGENTNIIIHKRNNKGCVVVIGFNDFIKILHKIQR